MLLSTKLILSDENAKTPSEDHVFSLLNEMYIYNNVCSYRRYFCVRPCLWMFYYTHRICFRLPPLLRRQLQDIGTGVIKSFHGNWRFFCSSLRGLGCSTNIIEDLSSSKSHSPWSQKRSKAGAKTFFWPSIKYGLPRRYPRIFFSQRLPLSSFGVLGP